MRIMVADVPPGMTVFQYIRSRCDHDRLAARCVPRVGRRARLSFDLGGTDLAALRAEVEAARGMASAAGATRPARAAPMADCR